MTERVGFWTSLQETYSWIAQKSGWNFAGVATVPGNNQEVATQRFIKKLRAPIYLRDEINMGDPIAIQRDGSSWLRPARGTKATYNYYEKTHNERPKFSGISRTRLI